MFSDSNQCQRERCPKVTLDEAADKSAVHTSSFSPASHCFQSNRISTIVYLLLLRNFRRNSCSKLCIWGIFGVIWKVRMEHFNKYDTCSKYFILSGCFISIKNLCLNMWQKNAFSPACCGFILHVLEYLLPWWLEKFVSISMNHKHHFFGTAPAPRYRFSGKKKLGPTGCSQ